MKRSIYLLLVCLLACSTVAFTQTVTLSFTAKDAFNQHLQLNRVVITNQTQNWQETIYWPDTVLVTQNGMGIADVETRYTTSLQLSQNIPNPFTGTTEVSLTVAKEGEVGLQIADVNGKIVETQCMASLQSGIHQFRITLAIVGTYVMTAHQNDQTSSIKMICNDGTDVNKIEYLGSVLANDYSPKPAKTNPRGTTNNPFAFGDQMEYVGYAAINGTEAESQHITQAQNASQAIVLQFAETGGTSQDGQPCPVAATVTDVDNNTYNTVQIGTQCWMKENLRTTRYANGTSIALGSSTSTSTAYRYYPDDDQSNVSTYGYLYNWKAVMGNSSSSSANPSGAQGICPTGWHVPSDAEWTQLTDYVSSQSQYVCGSNTDNIAKALASTTGWDSSSNTCAIGNNSSANNATNFFALPACIVFGAAAYFWSSTEVDGDGAYSRGLKYNYTCMLRFNNYAKSGMLSVRCLSDN